MERLWSKFLRPSIRFRAEAEAPGGRRETGLPACLGGGGLFLGGASFVGGLVFWGLVSVVQGMFMLSDLGFP